MAKTKVPAPAAHKTLIGQFKAAVRCGTPLIAITTADQQATTHNIVKQVNGDRNFISWDVMRGFRPLNDKSAKVLAQFCPEPESYQNFAEAAAQAEKAPQLTVFFFHNAQRHVDDSREAQALCNLRDAFKADGRVIVLLAPQLKLPAELQTDVVVLDEPLPDQEQLAAIVKDVYASCDIEPPIENVYRAVEAIQGLPAFAAEQVTAMSVAVEGDQITGLDFDALWERKRTQIEQTPGLSVSREGIKFADLGGLEVIKSYLGDLLKGNSRPNAVVMLDELEKLLGGAAGDTSGVSQDQLGTLLSYMQDTKATGILLVGVPGSGKSAIAKAAGNEAGIPTIRLDLGASKGSLVGQSEAQLRSALKVISSVSNGSTLWLATCNGLASLPPELRRRFRAGLFYFDCPTLEERQAIWKVHRKHYKISDKDAQPEDTGWTGAEIEQCVELAWRLSRPLTYAAQFVVPISQSAPEKIEALRQQANGRWLNASRPGVYRIEEDAQPLAVAKVGPRKFRLDE